MGHRTVVEWVKNSPDRAVASCRAPCTSTLRWGRSLRHSAAESSGAWPGRHGHWTPNLPSLTVAATLMKPIRGT
jgi:hypothetical protein